MKYYQALAREHKAHICPFCSLRPEEILDETKYIYVTPSRAPYASDHVLVIPKRHEIWMKDLRPKELEELFKIIEKRTILLHKKHKDVDVLLKDCSVGKIRTIQHLHFHLIPDYVLM